jgi:hypothetical protein
VPVEDQLKFYDVWGSQFTFPHYAVDWGLDSDYQPPFVFTGKLNSLTIQLKPQG